MTDLEGLKHNLKQLSLHTINSIFEEEAQKCAKIKMSYSGYLGRLVEAEVLSKTERSIARRISKAKFPFVRTLESFDFSFQPCLEPRYINELAELAFLQKGENILFLGSSGVGKTHLAIALGVKSCIAEKKVLFMKVSQLLDDLSSHQVSRTLSLRLEALSRLDLLILDELGYDLLDKGKVNLFFQLVSSRYEKGSIILTSNKCFEEWSETFSNDAVAVAILDRLLHHSHIIAINGPSYRIKDKLKKVGGTPR
jgi:DNA replication protein DnaC